MPKVSVIIPVYNVEPYLRKCLDSVVGQTLKDIEIICIDDGSTDGSGAILDEYAQKDKRIKVIHKKNEGQSIARNIGINLAQGEYIGFVDSDDWLDDNFYAILYATAKQSEADIVKGNMCYMDNGIFDRTKSWNIRIKKEASNSQHIITKFRYEFSTAIYRNSIIKEKNIRFKKATFAEDINFLCHFLCWAKLYKQCDDVFYYYRGRKSSVTKNLTTKHLDDLYEMCVDMNETIRLCKIDRTSAHLFNKMRLQELKSYISVASRLGYLAEYENLIMNFEKLCKLTKIKKYRLFGVIPLLKIEEK